MNVFIYNSILYNMNNSRYKEAYNAVIRQPMQYNHMAPKICDFCKATGTVLRMFVKSYAKKQVMFCYLHCIECTDLAIVNVMSYDFNEYFPNFHTLYNKDLKVIRSNYILDSGWVLFDATPIYGTFYGNYMVEVYKKPLLHMNSTCQQYNMKLLISIDTLVQLNS
jgi:hypothetical protein